MLACSQLTFKYLHTDWFGYLYISQPLIPDIPQRQYKLHRQVYTYPNPLTHNAIA
jgi:hypothetical protein